MNQHNNSKNSTDSLSLMPCKPWWICNVYSWIPSLWNTFTSPRPNDLQLVFAQVITRHGTRTPLCKMPENSGFKEPECVISSTPAFSYMVHADLWAGFHNPDEQPTGPCSKPVHPFNLVSNINQGSLTMHGVTEMIGVGKWLRETYVEKYKLLPDSYDPAFLFVRLFSQHNNGSHKKVYNG